MTQGRPICPTRKCWFLLDNQAGSKGHLSPDPGTSQPEAPEQSQGAEQTIGR